MSSSATGKEVDEAMTVDVDWGSASTVAESMTLEANQDSDAGAPALTMADSWVRCAAVSMRPACWRCDSAAVSESPQGRATRLPVPMAHMSMVESWVTSSEILLDVVGEAVGDVEDVEGADADGLPAAEGSAVDDADGSAPGEV